MRSRAALSALLFGVAAAQQCTVVTVTDASNSTAVSTSCSGSSTSATASTTATASLTAYTVATDSSGQFTAINDAIASALKSGVPTVTVKAGTYTQTVSIAASQTVTVVGESAASSDNSQNQVTITNSGIPLTLAANAVGVTFRNINFQTSGTNAVYLRGNDVAFYGCQIVSAGAQAIYATNFGQGIIANSYIEGSDKVFAGYPTLYVYGSTISVTAASNAIMLYTKGPTYNSVQYNSTVVFDSTSIVPKSGITNTIYLAAPNGAGSVAIWRNCSLASYITAAAIHPTAANYQSFYGEYASTGAGSYANNKASRSQYDVQLTTGQLDTFSLSNLFANALPPFGSSSISWVDSGVVNAISQADAAQTSAVAASSTSSAVSTSAQSSSSSSSLVATTNSTSAAASTSTVSSSIVSSSVSSTSSIVSSSSSSSVSSVVSTASSVSSSSNATSSVTSSGASSANSATTTLSSNGTTVVASSTASSASASSSSTCVLPSGVPSTAVVVGPAGSCAQYNSISYALGNATSTATLYVYILAGTYTEQISTARSGSTTFRGETDNVLDAASNKVTVQFSSGIAPNSGSVEGSAVFRSTTSSAKNFAFYAINFSNTYPATSGYGSIAMDIKASQVGFYSCSFTSSQNTLLVVAGTSYFANCVVYGTTDFVWAYGGAYLYNSKIVATSTGTGNTIAAQAYTATLASSQIVFDTCAIVPGSSAVSKGSVYLGRDYSTSSRVAYINSFLDAHIASAGWYIKTASTANVTFVEANNTGAGAARSNAPVTIGSDASSYTIAGALGSSSWIDTSAVAPFSGFPDSVYGTTVSSSSATSSTIPASTSASLSSNSTVSANATTSAISTSTSAAATSTSTFVVSTTPAAGEYANITAAINALPSDGKPYTIVVRAGVYNEQLSYTRTGKLTLRGDTTFANDFSQNTVKVEFSSGQLTSAGKDEQTPVLNVKHQTSDTSGVAVYNIDFINTYPQTSNTAALAGDFYLSNFAAYGCSFVGFQDTLLANKGTQLFSNCYIEGSIDYIWGFSTAFFHGCKIAANTAGGCISAMSRSSATAAGGYVFDSCLITYTSAVTTFGTSFLGRPYSNYSIAIYTNSYIDKHISSAGWSVWQTSSPQTGGVTFGEYNNTGPSAWSSSRASFATQLTSTQAQAYTLASWLGDTSWIDMDTYNLVPSYSTYGASSTTSPTTTANSTSTATASSTATAVWGHPSSGTTPPAGAVLVSPNGAVAGSYANLTNALASLPSDSSTQIVFMYAGTYNEQVPSINRAGPVQIIGYTTDSPGKTYSTNQVIITFARGLSVSPVPTGHSDAETATVSTASTKIAFYNINIINSDNLDGSQSSYVTLAGSIYGNDVGFYGCSLVGWQDTLLTGATAGYQYYESSYIEGAIDFIWGYSKAYFKGCTIGAKRASSAITAHSRASLSAIGGYIFDQCLFTQASAATTDLSQTVYLGRPYSQYAWVYIKNSYLDKTIAPAGWKVWSTTDPRTDHIYFAEYNNDGPGNWGNNSAARLAFGNATLLTSDAWTLESVMDSTSWIDMTYWNSISTPQPATVATTTPVANGTSSFNGTVPPSGAYIVSKTAIAGQTVYSSIQDALNALPTSSSKTPVVFIYPGVYEEQLVVNRSGTTIFRGYSEATEDYTQNQVTIRYNTGVNTQSDQSNSDSATVYATGNFFQAFNINFDNNFGFTQDYATLGFAVKSSKYAGLYGCQVTGGQDSLLINGFFFAFNSYVAGTVDFIWGSGAGYFLNSTISPLTDDINITADKRATNTTAAGFVFDQCRVVPAASAGTLTDVSLGRPWNDLARVAYVYTYLDSMIIPAGWEQWSKSSPQTDAVLFGEYHNTGPGASTSSRASFSEQISDSDVVQFELANFFSTTSWINFTVIDVQPFTPGTYSNVTTSSVLPTSTATTTSRSSSSTSALSTTSVVYTTITVSSVSTITTTLSNVVVATSTAKVTEDDGLTVTPAASYKTTTDKYTTSVTTTVTQPDVTKSSVVTETVGQEVTITQAPSTKTTPVKSTSTVYGTTTVAGDTTTIKTTTTVLSVYTSSPKPTTITSFAGSTATVVSTSTPKGTTISTTVTVAAATTTSTQVTTSTSTVLITSVGTKTSKVTTTIKCIPTAAKVKRDIVHAKMPRSVAARAAGVSTITSTTVIYTTKTVTAVGTSYTAVTSTVTTGKTTTLKASVATVTVSSAVEKDYTVTEGGSTVSTVVTTTQTLAGTTTVTAAVQTVTSTSFAYKTSYSTVSEADATVYSYKTITSVSTSVVPQSTATVVSSKDVTITSVETAAAPTVTSGKTSSAKATTVVVTSFVVETKTSTVKSSSTVYVTSTKTSKGAAACTA